MNTVTENVKTEFGFALKVGDGVSLSGYSDVTPYEVIEVSKSGKKAKIREMKATRSPNWKPEISVGGFAGHCTNNRDQEWVLESDEDGFVREISLRKVKLDPKYNKGFTAATKWVPVGQKAEVGRNPVKFGARKFYDYNF